MTNVEPPADSAPRFASLAASAFEAIHHKLAPHKAAARDAAISAWLEGHEDDAAQLARQVLGDILQHPELPAEAKPIFELLLRPEHQTQAILTVLGVYPIVSSFVMAAVGPFVQDIQNLAWAGHTSLPLAPAEIALALLRDTLGTIDPYAEAAMSGVNKQRLDVLELNTGEPPGLMQLLELYRRGEIDVDRLKRGVKQSRVRDEWFDAIEALRFAPPSPVEAIVGFVKGHIDEAESRKLFAEGGVDPKHWEWFKDTAGRPPGAEGLLSLLNRGLITEDDFHDAIKQSDIQNRWADALLAERRYIFPVRSIVPMIRSEAISDEYARTLMGYHGMIPEDMDVIIREGHSVKAQQLKDLSVANVRALYADGLIDATEAVAEFVKHGYDATESAQLVELVDASMTQKYTNAAVAHVHQLFVKHRIDQSEASNNLDALGVHHNVRDNLLRVWLIERKLNVVTLTLAQCQGSWRRGVMTDEDFAARVRALGHEDDDIPLLKALAFPPSDFTHGPSPRDI